MVSFPEAGQKIQRFIDFKDDASIQDLFEGWDGILEPEAGLRETVSDGAVQLYIMEVFDYAAAAESRSAMTGCLTMRWSIFWQAMRATVKI